MLFTDPDMGASTAFLQIEMIDQCSTSGGIRSVQRRHCLPGSQVAIEAKYDADVEHGGGTTPYPFHLSCTDVFRKQIIVFVRTFYFAFKNPPVFVVLWSQKILNLKLGFLFRSEFCKAPVIDLVNTDRIIRRQIQRGRNAANFSFVSTGRSAHALDGELVKQNAQGCAIGGHDSRVASLGTTVGFPGPYWQAEKQGAHKNTCCYQFHGTYLSKQSGDGIQAPPHCCLFTLAPL